MVVLDHLKKPNPTREGEKFPEVEEGLEYSWME